MEKIGDYIESYVKGKVPKNLFENNIEEMLPYLSPDYLRGVSTPEFYTNPNKKTVQVLEGDVLVLWDGSNAGEIFISKDGILASTMVKLVFDEDKLEKRYFAYTCKHLEYILKAKTAGSGIPHVDKGVIKKLEFNLPPFPEQLTIAGILSKLDDAIEATENSIKAAEKLKKSLMQNLLTGKLKPEGTWRTEKDFYIDEKFGKVPKEWEVGKLGDIAIIIAGQSPSGDTYNNEGKGLPMLNGPTEFTDLYPIPIQFTTRPIKVCEVGDILFTVRGSSTGRMNIADQVYCIGRGIAAIRENSNSDIDFIYYTLTKIAGKILAEAKGSGSTFPNVNRGELLKKKVIFPKLRSEQKDIAKIIKDVGFLMIQKYSKIQTIQTLKKSLMQNLLTGKVRVDVEKINALLGEA